MSGIAQSFGSGRVLLARWWSRSRAAAAAALLGVVSAGCSVDIHNRTPPAPPGSQFTARAETVRHGTNPTGVTLKYRHVRAADQNVSAEMTAPVTSNGDTHTATVTAPAGAAFQPFDGVRVTWRVAFSSWGQQTGNNDTATIHIDPTLRLILNPTDVIAGNAFTGILSIGQPRDVDTPVTLTVTDEPTTATLTMVGATVIPAHHTASDPFQVTTVATPEPSGGVVVPGAGADGRRCVITATVTIPSVGDFKATSTVQIRRQ